MSELTGHLLAAAAGGWEAWNVVMHFNKVSGGLAVRGLRMSGWAPDGRRAGPPFCVGLCGEVGETGSPRGGPGEGVACDGASSLGDSARRSVSFGLAADRSPAHARAMHSAPLQVSLRGGRAATTPSAAITRWLPPPLPFSILASERSWSCLYP